MCGTDGNALDRAKVYEFLAGIFLKEPNSEVFDLLKNWVTSMEEDTELSALLKRIKEKDPTLESLRQEYYDLFFVPVSGRYVPPFEAAIRGALREEGMKTKFGSFWGNETLQISQTYEQLGFRPEKLDVFEPLKQMNMPDHIGFELSFMAYLCQVEENFIKNNQSAESVRNLESTLLNKHLNRWLPLLIEDLKNVEFTGFYSYFVELARDLCEEEERIFKS
jgi:putative dimethyl sulfoxide reductase chaperone